jgi:methionyl-tRNA formyltransferase
MGNNIRGVLCLKVLVENGEHVIEVVGHPNLKEEDPAESVLELAKNYNLPIYQPTQVNAPEFVKHVRDLAPDLVILAGYNQILKRDLIDIPKLGCINLHGGKLPEYRGVAPINWQIIQGEKTGGIAIIFVDEGIDTGDIIAQVRFDITLEDTAKTVLDKTLALFPSLLLEVIAKFKSGAVPRTKQNREEGCYYTRRYPRDGQIRWQDMTAWEAYNLIRGLVKPYPGAFTFHRGEKLFIWKAAWLSERIRGIPGRVCLRRENGVVVLAKDRGVLIEEVQPETGPVMSAHAYFKNLRDDLT